jgi:dolichol-phosphate mannosyltransferase
MYYKQMSSQLRLSVVVPVYNNADTLRELTYRIFAILSTEFIRPDNYEVIFVVDGSPDDSLSILINELKECKGRSERIQIIELSRNYGQTAAIVAGIEHSKAKACVVISADLQDPPEEIRNLLSYWNDGYEIVISTRKSRDDGRVIALTSKLAHTLFRIAQPDMPRNGFDFFLISREVAKHLIEIRGRNRFLQGDILSLGFRRKIIAHDRGVRKVGHSAYTFKSRFKLFVDSIFENTRFPITMIFVMGTTVSMLGFLITLLSVINYFVGSTPFNGFAAIFSSILFLGGIQIFLIGLVGQFIFRSFEIVRGRPLYVIRKIL